MDYAQQLDLADGEFESLLDRFERGQFEDLTYRYLPDARRGIERGTVLAAGRVVRGFPKVPRTLVASEGIPGHFADHDEVVVEEKLNGYNVRVVRLDGAVYAFTRSGYACPFTTARVRGEVETSVLDARPGLVLCGEVYGPETPYTDHDYPGVDSLAFRAFDLRELASGEPLAVDERRDLLADHGVPQVPLLGRYTPAEAARAVPEDHVPALDAEEREGVVVKSADGRRLLKYTTSAANQGDLAYAFSLPFDYGQDFLFRRVVREAFQAVEFDETDAEVRERAHGLGEAILEPMVETVRAVERGEPAGEHHTVRGGPEIDALLSHLRDLGLSVTVEADRREDGERVVEFRKEAQATTDKTRNYLDGHVVRE